MIQLFIDSTTDIPESFFSHHSLKVIPLMVTVHDKSYRDRYEISIDDLYTEMRNGILPKTSLPNLEEISHMFEESCQSGMDVCYLAFSSAMSGTCQAAQLIGRDIMEKYPSRTITVIDSEGGSIATGLIAMQMQLWIEKGFSMDQLTAHALDMISHIQHLFTIPNLDWLVKGGRVQKQVGYIGDKLNIKPILHVKEGTMHVFSFARGRKNALQKLLAILEERSARLPQQVIGIAHADDLSTAQELQAMIASALPEVKTFICEIGCVLGTHLGIGGVGLFYLKDAVSDYTLLDEFR